MEGWREKVCERGTELLDQGEIVVSEAREVARNVRAIAYVRYIWKGE